MAAQANPFDELAPFYDSWFDTPLGAAVGALERGLLLRLARPQPGERALEVGVGTGYFARALAEAGARVVGVDLSQPMLRQAAVGAGLGPAPADLALVRGDARALPLAAAQFDLVLTVTMLEFVPEPERAIAEMWAAVRSGGRLVVAVLNAWSPWARRREPPFDRAHYYSPPALRRLLGGYGRVQRGSTVFFLPDGRLRRYSACLEALGRSILRPFGALLIGRVDK